MARAPDVPTYACACCGKQALCIVRWSLRDRSEDRGACAEHLVGIAAKVPWDSRLELVPLPESRARYQVEPFELSYMIRDRQSGSIVARVSALDIFDAKGAATAIAHLLNDSGWRPGL